MQIFYLDSEFKILKMIRASNIQWRRKYYECGSFSIQISPEYYEPLAKYIYTPDRKEIGVISQINYIKDKRQTYIQISGLFAESLLDKAVCFSEESIQSSNVGKALIKFAQTWYTQCECVPNIIFKNPTFYAGDTKFNAIGDNIGKKMYTMCKLHKISYSISLEDSNLVCRLYQGVDRSVEQSSNDVIIFSTTFNSLNKLNLLISDTDYKNHYLAKLSGQVVGAESEYVYRYTKDASITDKRWVTIDVSEITDDYSTALNQCSQTLTNEYDKVIDLDFDTDSSNYEYLKDFDLGDIVTVLIPELGLNSSSRIIEITETFKKNSHKLSLKFGNKIITSNN